MIGFGLSAFSVFGGRKNAGGLDRQLSPVPTLVGRARGVYVNRPVGTGPVFSAYAANLARLAPTTTRFPG